MFEIKFDSQAEKFLTNCEGEILDRISEKIETLKQNPVPHNSKRILGCEIPTFRIRIGKYRTLYRINYEKNLIIVVKIDKREKVYD